MSVKFDLTIAGAEILDSVIFMENSPAYSAFKEEIEKILADFNKNKRFGDTADIDVRALVDGSEGTMRHMQRAFLIWTFNEDYGKKQRQDMEYSKFLKLFIKSQEKYLTELNGGSKNIDVTEIDDLRKKYIDAVSARPEIFNSVKEFFAGYVYGYFFNYLNEQTIMRDYAEFLVCLGIMSNKISATEIQRQKIMPKMALLLNNDRFKYISGEIPLEVMFNIVYDRLELTAISDAEDNIIRDALKEYIISNYEFRESDGLIADTVVTDVMTRLNGKYVCAPDFTSDLHKNSFDGVRTFLDSDRNDMGEYTYEKLLSVIDTKCGKNLDSYFSADRAPVIEVALGADCKGYKYPLVYKDGDVFWFADIYKELLFPYIDSAAFVSVSSADLPIDEFPFTDSALHTNIIRFLGGLETDGYTVRTDKRALLDDIKKIKASAGSNTEKRMLTLEKTLCVISGNMDCKSYMRLLGDCFFGTELYNDYIRYRMDCLFEKGIANPEAKKNLLDNINSIS
ncbi:MAG: hypothetical protein ACI4JF_06780 [Oscillospiraceae bacterium]